MLWFQLLSVALCICTCTAFDPTTYTDSQQPLPRYTVYWRADEAEQTLYLALHVQTKGWVGFGISEPASGSMPGSDVIMGNVQNGKGSITDGWTSQFAYPNTDDCQDWILVNAEESDGFTTLEVKRPFDTRDPQDRVITPGINSVILAFGEDDAIGYHQSNRITSQIVFYGKSPVQPLPDTAKFIDLRMNDYAVPDGETFYVCQAFALPVDQEYNIIQIDPLLQEENIAHLHHYLIHSCSNVSEGYVPLYQEPGVCWSPVGNPNAGCNGLLAAWAAGGGPIVLPSVAGFPMGSAPTATQFIVLELHYNNPDLVGGYTDHSGVRLWYTTEKRQYEAATLTIGDPVVSFDSIPAQSVKEYEAECPSPCTSTMPHEITVFQSFPHMHQVGSQIWSTQWRDGVQIAEIGRVEYWTFNHQQIEQVNVTIRPGDRLNTHCVYDTRSKSTKIDFGESSDEEMCMHFLSYYPRIVSGNGEVFANCGRAGPNYTLCGKADELNLLNYPNPTLTDPPGGINRTYGLSPTECQKSDTTTTATSKSALLTPVVLLYALFVILVISW